MPRGKGKKSKKNLKQQAFLLILANNLSHTANKLIQKTIKIYHEQSTQIVKVQNQARKIQTDVQLLVINQRKKLIDLTHQLIRKTEPSKKVTLKIKKKSGTIFKHRVSIQSIFRSVSEPVKAAVDTLSSEKLRRRWWKRQQRQLDQHRRHLRRRVNRWIQEIRLELSILIGTPERPSKAKAVKVAKIGKPISPFTSAFWMNLRRDVGTQWKRLRKSWRQQRPAYRAAFP